MIFSRWRPDTGGYDYFNSLSTRYGLGDDLPVPRLSPIHALGVCSTDIGRTLPADATPVGSGPLAKGMVAPMGTLGSTLSGALGAITNAGFAAWVLVAAAVGLGYLIGTSRK